MTDSPAELPQGPRSAAISNMVVRLVSAYTGRGPTNARTHISEDLVTVVLRDTLTKGERSLVPGRFAGRGGTWKCGVGSAACERRVRKRLRSHRETAARRLVHPGWVGGTPS